MSTPTPETDAMVEQCQRQINVPTNPVSADFARKLERERDKLTESIRETLMENLHLADGDICTLKRLKDTIGFELPDENEESP